ncbi:unnamed protein product [Phyllotreta striolata]|uniref:Choline transporter-like protein n=1 Tax=Phyllotreta striolata TaxID=444603 RepID=A0A9N9TLK6_PHYSR|nr:unnamed protein product [Phyllotreta striolata]
MDKDEDEDKDKNEEEKIVDVEDKDDKEPPIIAEKTTSETSKITGEIKEEIKEKNSKITVKEPSLLRKIIGSKSLAPLSFVKETSKEEPSLAVFKKLPSNTLLDNIEIPERPENRVPTDRKFLIVFAVVVLLLFPFLIYCLVLGDLSRLKGYDQCGNVCGKKNSKYDEWPCTGQDYTDLPYLQVEARSALSEDAFLLSQRKCVASCDSNYIKIFSTCYLRLAESSNSWNSFRNGKSSSDGFPDDFPSFDGFSRSNYRNKRSSDLEDLGEGLSAYLNKHAWRIVLACFVSLGVAIIMLVLFKTATAAVVWGILGGVLLFGAILIGGLWYAYFNVEKFLSESSSDVEASKKGFLFMGIFFTVFWLILLCVTVFMYKKVQLVIQLLKEATKASFAMPLLIFIPILTFLCELVVLALLAFTSVYITTSGVLTEILPGYLYYKDNVAMTITFVFNVIVAFWSTQFIIGIQYMVIAGAVAKWYWSKNKENLGSPIADSASIVFKFHLGSIAFGSLVITIIAIIRAVLTSLTKNKNLKAVVDFCIGTLESFLKFLTKNSYILTAMHGKPFYKSGKRAAKIIFQNVVNISSVNYVGDFVLGMAQLLIVLISLLITVGIMQGAESDYSWIVYLIVFFVSLFIAITFFATFETTIDTLFLCFCEDSLLNDGMSRPYAMSRDLMEFVENSKKLYGDKKE